MFLVLFSSDISFQPFTTKLPRKTSVSQGFPLLQKYGLPETISSYPKHTPSRLTPQKHILWFTRSQSCPQCFAFWMRLLILMMNAGRCFLSSILTKTTCLFLCSVYFHPDSQLGCVPESALLVWTCIKRLVQYKKFTVFSVSYLSFSLL